MSATALRPFDIRLMNGVANLLFAAVALAAVVAFGLWLARLPVWALQGISVHGDTEHQNAVTFRAQLASRLQGNFLTLDLTEVQSLFEAVPWVQQAVVRRAFPNRLHVTLIEHQAVAWWGEAGGGQLVNAQGEVFEANPDDAQADRWSELIGPPGQSARVWAMHQRLAPVFERIGRDLRRLELDAQGSWRAVLDNQARIELGRGEVGDLLERLQGFASTVTTLTTRYGGRDIESADLRYPNGYALRLRGVTTLAEPPKDKPQP